MWRKVDHSLGYLCQAHQDKALWQYQGHPQPVLHRRRPHLHPCLCLSLYPDRCGAACRSLPLHTDGLPEIFKTTQASDVGQQIPLELSHRGDFERGDHYQSVLSRDSVHERERAVDRNVPAEPVC